MLTVEIFLEMQQLTGIYFTQIVTDNQAGINRYRNLKHKLYCLMM